MLEMKVKRREKRESHKRKRLRFVSNVGQPFFFSFCIILQHKEQFFENINGEKKKMGKIPNKQVKMKKKKYFIKNFQII